MQSFKRDLAPSLVVFNLVGDAEHYYGEHCCSEVVDYEHFDHQYFDYDFAANNDNNNYDDYDFAANDNIFEHDDDFIEHNHNVEHNHDDNPDDYNESEDSGYICWLLRRKLLGRIAATVLLE